MKKSVSVYDSFKPVICHILFTRWIDEFFFGFFLLHVLVCIWMSSIMLIKAHDDD